MKKIYNDELINTKSSSLKLLDEKEINTLSAMSEEWLNVYYEDNIDINFIKKLFGVLKEDPYVKNSHSLSEKEIQIVTEYLQEESKTDIPHYKENINKLFSFIEQNNFNLYSISAHNVLAMFSNMLSFDIDLLIILEHPDQETMKNNITESVFYNSFLDILEEELNVDMDLSSSIKKKIINNLMDNVENDKFEIDTEEILIKIFYQTPVFTTKANKEIHQFYWNNIMLDFYKSLLKLNQNTEILTVGCTSKFAKFIDLISAETNNFAFEIASSVYDETSSFKVDEYVIRRIVNKILNVIKI